MRAHFCVNVALLVALPLAWAATASAQIGVERFLKSLPTTSIEVSWDFHWANATRDDQFPSGYNSTVFASGIRVGGNYYFDPGADEKKKPAELPGTKKP